MAQNEVFILEIMIIMSNNRFSIFFKKKQEQKTNEPVHQRGFDRDFIARLPNDPAKMAQLLELTKNYVDNAQNNEEREFKEEKAEENNLQEPYYKVLADETENKNKFSKQLNKMTKAKKKEEMDNALKKADIVGQEKDNSLLKQYHKIINDSRRKTRCDDLGIPISKCPHLIELTHRLLFLIYHPEHPNNNSETGVNILRIKALASEIPSLKTTHLMWASRMKKSDIQKVVDQMLPVPRTNKSNENIKLSR